MNEKEAMEYIAYLNTLGSKPGLTVIRELLRRAGDPQKELAFIHIAGTNGKGSVSAFISNILMAAGYRVGRYNSPTIRTYRERIYVNKSMISKTALCRLLTQLKTCCDEMVADGFAHPTSFEVETVLGFLYYKEKNCDMVVLETGMGGRLDATNVIPDPQKLLAVFASVSMDHMAFLGDSLGQIAKEKAGIITQGCSVVTMEQREEVMDVFQKVCLEKQAVLTVSKPETASSIHYGLEEQTFLYRNRLPVTIRLAGNYQITNALLALQAAEILQQKGFRITDRAILKGMEQTGWHGRFEILSKKPYFIVDGAHNEDAARKLAQTVQFYFTNKKIIYIMGVLRDKEYEKIAEIMSPFADSIITVTTPGNPRALSALTLAETVAKYHNRVTAADSLEEAVEMSYLLADKDSVILAFGSLSYLGQIMDIIDKMKTKRA